MLRSKTQYSIPGNYVVHIGVPDLRRDRFLDIAFVLLTRIPRSVTASVSCVSVQ